LKQIIFHSTPSELSESEKRIKETVSNHSWETGYKHMFAVLWRKFEVKEAKTKPKK